MFDPPSEEGPLDRGSVTVGESSETTADVNHINNRHTTIIGPFDGKRDLRVKCVLFNYCEKCNCKSIMYLCVYKKMNVFMLLI